VSHYYAQDVLNLLQSGLFRGDGEILGDKLVNSSLKQLGADTADTASYKSMLLDAATVFRKRSARAAVCAWQAAHKAAAYKFKRLLDCSLIKVVNDQLWVHDVIKSIAANIAHSENEQCMTRIWLPHQVSTVVNECLAIELIDALSTLVCTRSDRRKHCSSTVVLYMYAAAVSM
jgi:hypothetical protein